MTLPPAPPDTDGQYLVSDTTGTLSFTPGSPVVQVYDGPNQIRDVIMYTFTATTTGGVATFYATKDGTRTGPAIFTTLLSISATAVFATTNANQVMATSINTISADLKIITINVANVNRQFAANGTKCFLLLIGI